MLCIQCQEPAYVHAEWNTSGGPQEADLCRTCMQEIWQVFKGSVSAGNTVFNFTPIQEGRQCDHAAITG